MKCEQLETLWMLYLDRKLPAAERSRMKAHIGECARCEARRDGLLAVSSALDEWEAPEPTPWFDAKLRQRITADSRSFGVAGWLAALAPRFPLSMAALLFMAALLVWIGGPNQGLGPREVVFNRPEEMDALLHVVDEVEMLSDAEFLVELKKPSPGEVQLNVPREN